jgi:hypothetical protein
VFEKYNATNSGFKIKNVDTAFFNDEIEFLMPTGLCSFKLLLCSSDSLKIKFNSISLSFSIDDKVENWRCC